MTMTALEITRALKAEKKNAILWINEDRREAVFHAGPAGCAYPVNFNDAIIARGDPAFGIVESCDGEVYAAL